MPNPYKEIISALENRFKKHTSKITANIMCELGTITDKQGLKLDSYKTEIYDYLVSFLYEKNKIALNPGDRVLVVPANNGRDFVVVARVAWNRETVSPTGSLICPISQLWHTEEQSKIDQLCDLADETKANYNAAVALINELRDKVTQLAALADETKAKYNAVVPLINEIRTKENITDQPAAVTVASSDVASVASAQANTVVTGDVEKGGWTPDAQSVSA
jgi:hypothetical protein